MVKDKKVFLFYRLGQFVAEIMLKGIIHPDMKISNVGFRNNAEPVFLDFPEIEKISIPDGLNENTVRQLTESLFPMLDGTEGSFLYCSYFRMGFLAYGGVLARELFCNMINNGYSSAIFVKHPKVNDRYDVSALFSDLKSYINEWIKLDLKSITLNTYDTLDKYNQSVIRKEISEHNQEFLDQMYFVNSVIVFDSNESTKIPLACVLLNMALSAANNEKPYTEYGLLKKCLKTYSGVEQIEEMCKSRLLTILPSGNLDPDRIEFIDECIDKYELFEFLWILSDVDVFSK